MHVRGGVVARLGVAAVAEVAGAGGVVDDEVEVGVLEGRDDIHSFRILLEIDPVHRQALVIHMPVESLDVLVWTGADGPVRTCRAVLDDGYVQQVGEEPVHFAEVDGHGVLADGADAVGVGEAPGVARGLLGTLYGVGHVRGAEVAPVVHLDAGVHGEGPVAAVVGAVARDDAGGELIVVAELEDVLEHQLAYEQVVRVVGGVGVQAGGGVVVEREDVVRRVRDAELLAGEHALHGVGFAVLCRRAAAREYGEREDG